MHRITPPQHPYGIYPHNSFWNYRCPRCNYKSFYHHSRNAALAVCILHQARCP